MTCEWWVKLCLSGSACSRLVVNNSVVFPVDPVFNLFVPWGIVTYELVTLYCGVKFSYQNGCLSLPCDWASVGFTFCRTRCWRYVSLASNHHGTCWQPIFWGCIPCYYPLPSGLSFQASQGVFITCYLCMLDSRRRISSFRGTDNTFSNFA